ncbi:MAG: Rab family GTPase [Candidatus Hodarchaeales archaeon]|jgi:small GTP-binding protein
MAEDNDLIIFKVVLAGPSGVGKTCLVHRFIDGGFSHDTKSTIGVDFFLKNVILDDPESGLNQRAALQIWDMAGEERFRYILPYYIMGTEGILYIFDITEPTSLAALDEWLDVTKTHLSGDVQMVLLSAKNDMDPVVTDADVEEFLSKTGIPQELYFKTSSLNGANVNEAFLKIAGLIMHSYDEE